MMKPEAIQQSLLFYTEANSQARGLVSYVVGVDCLADQWLVPRSLSCDPAGGLVGSVYDLHAGVELHALGFWGPAIDLIDGIILLIGYADLSPAEAAWVEGRLRARIDWSQKHVQNRR